MKPVDPMFNFTKQYSTETYVSPKGIHVKQSVERFFTPNDSSWRELPGFVSGVVKTFTDLYCHHKRYGKNSNYKYVGSSRAGLGYDSSKKRNCDKNSAYKIYLDYLKLHEEAIPQLFFKILRQHPSYCAKCWEHWTDDIELIAIHVKTCNKMITEPFIGEEFTPLWRISGKEEWLALIKFLEGIPRTFMYPNLLLSHIGSLLYYDMNTGLKHNLPHSLYGFIKQHGGFDEYFKNLPNTNHHDFDVSVYDGSVDYYSQILEHQLRMLLFNTVDHISEAQMIYVMYFSINSTLVGNFGQLLLTDHGNKSGSPGKNTTTTNQISGHMKFYTILYTIQQFQPEFQFPYWTHYSDDFYVSCPNSDFELICTYFKLVGWTVKDHKIHKDINLNDYALLGNVPYNYLGHYIPITPLSVLVRGLWMTYHRKITSSTHDQILSVRENAYLSSLADTPDQQVYIKIFNLCNSYCYKYNLHDKIVTTDTHDLFYVPCFRTTYQMLELYGIE